MVDGHYVLTGERRRVPFGRAVLNLMLHIFGAGVLFVSVFAVGWLGALAMDSMNAFHPFDAEVWRIRHVAEVWLTYVDILTSGVVVLTGASRFLKETMR